MSCLKSTILALFSFQVTFYWLAATQKQKVQRLPILSDITQNQK